jgi:hypothetical protein
LSRERNMSFNIHEDADFQKAMRESYSAERRREERLEATLDERIYEVDQMVDKANSLPSWVRKTKEWSHFGTLLDEFKAGDKSQRKVQKISAALDRIEKLIRPD